MRLRATLCLPFTTRAAARCLSSTTPHLRTSFFLSLHHLLSRSATASFAQSCVSSAESCSTVHCYKRSSSCPAHLPSSTSLRSILRSQVFSRHTHRASSCRPPWPLNASQKMALIESRRLSALGRRNVKICTSGFPDIATATTKSTGRALSSGSWTTTKRVASTRGKTTLKKAEISNIIDVHSVLRLSKTTRRFPTMVLRTSTTTPICLTPR